PRSGTLCPAPRPRRVAGGPSPPPAVTPAPGLSRGPVLRVGAHAARWWGTLPAMAHRGPEPRRPPPAGRQLTVAVTGPTGTFGHALLPLLESDERIGRVVGIARRPFDPAEH